MRKIFKEKLVKFKKNIKNISGLKFYRNFKGTVGDIGEILTSMQERLKEIFNGNFKENLNMWKDSQKL